MNEEQAIEALKQYRPCFTYSSGASKEYLDGADKAMAQFDDVLGVIAAALRERPALLEYQRAWEAVETLLKNDKTDCVLFGADMQRDGSERIHCEVISTVLNGGAFTKAPTAHGAALAAGKEQDEA